MAKGNFLTGNVRGKIGDMVFYRQAGEQIIRPRTAHPHNPNTVPQRYQRAIMATILQNYAAGCEIFDHSFQGYRRGRECQARFLQLNLKTLRAYMANDLNNMDNPAAQWGNVVAPRVPYPVPFERMYVSEGSYTQNIFLEEDSHSYGRFRIMLPEADPTMTRQQYADSIGLIPNDIFTFVGFLLDSENEVFRVPDSDDFFGTQLLSSFFYIRLRVRETPANPDDTMRDAPRLSAFFDVDSYKGVAEPNISLLFYNDDLIEIILGNAAKGAFSLIRSHLNKDLRSTSYLHLLPTNGDFGIRTRYALEAWSPETMRLGDSEVILEGGDD